MIQVSCEYCQKSFLVRKSEYRLRQFGLKHSLTCSRECSVAIRRGRPNLKRRRQVELICEQCGKTFIETQVHAQARRFCSIQCKAESQKTSLRGESNPFFGRKHSEETRKKISANHFRWYGDENPNWRGGVTELKKLIRKSKKYKQWREQVYQRDHYRSVSSGKRGRSRELVAHHIKPFIEIVREFLALHPDLDIESDKSELFRLALKYKPFWDVANGITLLRDEHQALHSNQNDRDDDED